MRIGIPKETTLEEKRVGLAPAGADALIKEGHKVFIESGAGLTSNFSDEDYRKTGAEIVYGYEEVFCRSEIIVKVAPISESEAVLVPDNGVVFSFMNVSLNSKAVFEEFQRKNVTAIGYDQIESMGTNPIVTAMSEIAGQIAVVLGEKFLMSDFDKSRGVLLGGVTGVAPAAVVIIGAGNAGRTAATQALGRGAQVIILDKDVEKLRVFEKSYHSNVTTVVANPYTIERGVKFADILITAIKVRGERMPHIVSESLVKTMKRGAVIVDLSIDQGGAVETSRLTSVSNQVYEKHGVFHSCIPNLPALVSRTSTYALTNAALPFILAVAKQGLKTAISNNEGLMKGVCTYEGYCSNELIAESFGLEYRRIHLFLET